MSRREFDRLMDASTQTTARKAADARPTTELDTRFGAETGYFGALACGCQGGVEEDRPCTHEGEGIRDGHLIGPNAESRNFSVDVVTMRTAAGPYRVHPNGAPDLVTPLARDARFDRHGAGGVAYRPGPKHRPTATGGRALVSYQLPAAAIQFTRECARTP